MPTLYATALSPRLARDGGRTLALGNVCTSRLLRPSIQDGPSEAAFCRHSLADAHDALEDADDAVACSTPMTTRRPGWLLALPLIACTHAVDVAPGAAPPLVEIVARGLRFEAPNRIAPGWTTLRLRNASGMVHFAIVERLPEGRRIADHQAEVAPVFQRGMDLLIAGDAPAALEAFGELPAWFGEIVFLGGPGLVAAGAGTDVTVNLTPGTYLLECYVKTGGLFHSFNPTPGAFGMVHELVVGGSPNGAAEPRADFTVTVSREKGIEMHGEPGPGPRTVAVRFEDQGLHENFVGHDVHLARLADDTDLDALATWMDWMEPPGLQTPAPVAFVGGVNEMPAGERAYLHVTLEPGRYAWIAEVTDPQRKGMLKTFVVR